MKVGSTIAEIANLEERSGNLIGAIVQAAYGLAGDKFTVGAGLAKRFGGEVPSPCVMVEIGSFEEPFLTHEIRLICKAIKSTPHADKQPLAKAIKTFIRAALSAADEADRIPASSWKPPKTN